ncbi:MAG: hypothetical protein ACI9WU_002924 [Myxococcota bacterium]|jgi:hypothetical protein
MGFTHWFSLVLRDGADLDDAIRAPAWSRTVWRWGSSRRAST